MSKGKTRPTTGVRGDRHDNGAYISVDEGRRISDKIGRGTPGKGIDVLPERKTLLKACHGKGPGATLRALRALYLKSLRVRLTMVEECRCPCPKCLAARKRGWTWVPMHLEDIATLEAPVPLQPLDTRFDVEPSAEELL